MESTSNRFDFFDADGKPKPVEIRTWQDLFDKYDREFAELGGIEGGLVVENDVIYYATGAGGVVVVKVFGLPEVAEEPIEP